MALKSASPAALQILEEAGISELPEGWTVVRVEDLLSDDRGISVGVMYPGDHDPQGIPLIKAGDLTGSRINPAPEFRVTREKHYEYRRTELAGGELLISLVGNVGRCAVVPPSMKGWNAARAVAVLRFATEDDAQFVRACLTSSPLQHLMQAWSTTTVQATLNLKEIRQLPLPWPPRREQRAIAHILGTLDDKIELNRRMNETLEAMARALFQSWFVDFDPVHRNIQRAQGHTPPNPQLADFDALFPYAFEDSELGPIPQGWQVGRLSDTMTFEGGAQPPASHFISEPREGYVRLVQIRDFYTSNHLTFVPETSKLRRFDKDDIMIARYGSSGNSEKSNDSLARICRGLCGAYNVALVKVIPLKDSREFLGYFLQSTSFQSVIKGMGARSVQSGFRKEDLDVVPLVTASSQVHKTFEEFAYVVWQRTKAFRESNETLTTLRDTLLPKLISGELRVKDAEKFVEGVV